MKNYSEENANTKIKILLDKCYFPENFPERTSFHEFHKLMLIICTILILQIAIINIGTVHV